MSLLLTKAMQKFWSTRSFPWRDWGEVCRPCGLSMKDWTSTKGWTAASFYFTTMAGPWQTAAWCIEWRKSYCFHFPSKAGWAFHLPSCELLMSVCIIAHKTASWSVAIRIEPLQQLRGDSWGYCPQDQPSTSKQKCVTKESYLEHGCQT